MIKEGRLRRGGLVVILLAALASAWWVWLRPVGPRQGPAPVALQDGWTISSPAAEGFDARALERAIGGVLDKPLDVHAVLVERHGRLVSESYQGGMDHSVYALVSIRHDFGPEQLHDVRSVGKSITSLLYGIALGERRVPDLSAYVLDSYPALERIASPPSRAIRIQNLLDMSSGLDWREGEPGRDDELRLFWKRDVPGYVLSRRVVNAPGTAFNYDGGGTAVLADLITRGAGMPLDAYARQRLFAPMAITHWTWIKDLHGRPMAFNGLRMRPRDLLKVGRLVLAHGQWDGRQLVPAAWIDRSMQPHLATGVSDFRYGSQWWGGSVRWHGQPVAWHAAFGNGGQRLFVLPALDLAIVTTAGTYDQLTTAIAVNRLVQSVVDSVRE